MGKGSTFPISIGKPLLIASLAACPVLATDKSAQTPVTSEPTDPSQKIKCRKYQAPGSLVRKIKTCRTIAEWRRIQQAGNDAARAIVGENVCSGGECRGYEPPDAPE